VQETRDPPTEHVAYILTNLIVTLISNSMQVKQTATFSQWFSGLRDSKAKSKIAGRIARMELGLMGQTRTVHDGVSEAKIDFGPGYRLYYTLRGPTLIILLIGGDKGSQARDIAKAKEMAAQIP
jgi:putative addiction module killer protein